MGEENRHDGVLLLNEHGGLCVLFRDFGIQIIPLNKKRKKDGAISVHEARYSRMQIMIMKARTWGTFWVDVAKNWVVFP